MTVSIDMREYPPHEPWIRDMETGEWLCAISDEIYPHLERLLRETDNKISALQRELSDLKGAQPCCHHPASTQRNY